MDGCSTSVVPATEGSGTAARDVTREAGVDSAERRIDYINLAPKGASTIGIANGLTDDARAKA